MSIDIAKAIRNVTTEKYNSKNILSFITIFSVLFFGYITLFNIEMSKNVFFTLYAVTLFFICIISNGYYIATCRNEILNCNETFPGIDKFQEIFNAGLKFSIGCSFNILLVNLIPFAIGGTVFYYLIYPIIVNNSFDTIQSIMSIFIFIAIVFILSAISFLLFYLFTAPLILVYIQSDNISDFFNFARASELRHQYKQQYNSLFGNVILMYILFGAAASFITYMAEFICMSKDPISLKTIYTMVPYLLKPIFIPSLIGQFINSLKITKEENREYNNEY